MIALGCCKWQVACHTQQNCVCVCVFVLVLWLRASNMWLAHTEAIYPPQLLTSLPTSSCLPHTHAHTASASAGAPSPGQEHSNPVPSSPRRTPKKRRKADAARQRNCEPATTVCDVINAHDGEARAQASGEGEVGKLAICRSSNKIARPSFWLTIFVCCLKEATVGGVGGEEGVGGREVLNAACGSM